MSRRPHASETETSPLLNGDAEPAPPTQQDSPPPPPPPPPSQTFKIFATMSSFLTLGLFNSSLGALLPLLTKHYHLTDLSVSCIFLASPIGYMLAAQASAAMHLRYGQRGIAVAGPVCQILATVAAAMHPSFGWLLVAFVVQGVGMGLLDGSWCAWAGGMERGNTVSGLLHGSYSVGGAGAPWLVTVLLEEKGWGWWRWYWGLAAACTVSLILLTAAFRNEDATSYRRNNTSALLATTTITTNPATTKPLFAHPATWFCAAYFLTYVGTETTISGWLVSFMYRYRHLSLSQSGLTSSGYWIGMATGRLLLGYATDKIGVRRATTFYFFVAITIEAAFAVVTSSTASVALMVMLGFVMGPLFPSGVVVLTRLLPGEVHVKAVSFVASLGQVGGAVLPFAIGAVVEGVGIGVFRWAILAQTVVAVGVWVAFARLRPWGVRDGV
ncbi:mfs transporter [Pyrenophora seminiperda CCB06]|uniref:Mfs transporter n=1 Tax=Pyrenophora seminiperda CCB06 TaxID=1302712 RepID=A0A3M7M412_9PLEO|nr:mfs transporter [Pyrenophora seminiperda CCB06]